MTVAGEARKTIQANRVSIQATPQPIWDALRRRRESP